MTPETMRQDGLRESLARTVYGIVAYDAGHAASVEEGRYLWDLADRQAKVAYRIAIAPFAQKDPGSRP